MDENKFSTNCPILDSQNIFLDLIFSTYWNSNATKASDLFLSNNFHSQRSYKLFNIISNILRNLEC